MAELKPLSSDDVKAACSEPADETKVFSLLLAIIVLLPRSTCLSPSGFHFPTNHVPYQGSQKVS